MGDFNKYVGGKLTTLWPPIPCLRKAYKVFHMRVPDEIRRNIIIHKREQRLGIFTDGGGRTPGL